MQHSSDDRFDVLVVGGGPAGSTAAALLARRGWRVLQAEKTHHPRFHIGESLLPANVPLLAELGVLAQVREMGVLKLGADFPDGQDYRSFGFDRALGTTPPFAFQVRRDRFDAMLFAHARLCGVDTREGVRVDQVAFHPDGVSARLDGPGGGSAVHARYLIDASGRDTLLGTAMGLKRADPRHRTAAIFGHFRGVERRPEPHAGNISIYRFAHGWAWFIPLPDGETSIGCVCSPEYLRLRAGGDRGEFLLDTLRTMPEAWRRMAGAEPVGSTGVAGNYSYSCRALTGRRWLMVGDAFAFVDPIFSSGVFLAMDSAREAVDVVDGTLRDPGRERRLQRAFERRVRAGVRAFSWFIHRFNSPVMQRLFASPANTWQLEQGVISMLAGDVFDSAPVRRRLRVFKAIYAVAAVLDLRRALAHRRERRRQAGAAAALGAHQDPA